MPCDLVYIRKAQLLVVDPIILKYPAAIEELRKQLETEWGETVSVVVSETVAEFRTGRRTVKLGAQTSTLGVSNPERIKEIIQNIAGRINQELLIGQIRSLAYVTEQVKEADGSVTLSVEI